MNIVVPQIDDSNFIKLENLIDSEFESAFIESVIDSSEERLDCFNILEKKIEKDGGNIILGWQIWKSEILIEAEAHAVWENSDGVLYDISPKEFNLKPEEILFIEDPRLKYEGKQIDNIRLNITKNKLVDHFIELSKLFFHYRNKGKRADYHDLSLILNENEINEIQEIYMWKTRLNVFIYQGNTVDSLCFCGGTKRYKNCHGKDFYKQIKRIKTKPNNG